MLCGSTSGGGGGCGGGNHNDDGAFTGARIATFTLPGKKWHWRLLVSAAHFAEIIPPDVRPRFAPGTLFVTSLMNLADLIALRPDLARRRKVLYFHENQFAYPSSQQHQELPAQQKHPAKMQKSKKAWSDYGWAQIMSCLAADEVLFNSEYNKKTFLKGAERLLSMIPAPSRPAGIPERIAAKSRVLYFPLLFLNSPVPVQNYATHVSSTSKSGGGADDVDVRPLHVVWPHRWEHDKGPDVLMRVIRHLDVQSKRNDFAVWISVLGEQFPEYPEEFNAIRDEFWRGQAEGQAETNSGETNVRHHLHTPGVHLLHFGHVETRAAYEDVLLAADVVLSTARHDFFGSSTMEAVYLGCVPLCPDALVYPELYPSSCLYRTEAQLLKRLRNFARRPDILRRTTAPEMMSTIAPENYTLSALQREYGKVLGVVVDSAKLDIQFSPLTMVLLGLCGVSMLLHFALLLFEKENGHGKGGQ